MKVTRDDALEWTKLHLNVGRNKLQLWAALLKTGAAELPFRNALSLKISKGCERPPDYREQTAVPVPAPRDTML